MSDRVTVDPALLDTIGTPSLVVATVGLLAGQVDAAGPLTLSFLEGLTSWPEPERARAVDYIDAQLGTLHTWVTDALGAVAEARIAIAAEAEETGAPS